MWKIVVVGCGRDVCKDGGCEPEECGLRRELGVKRLECVSCICTGRAGRACILYLFHA